MPNRHRSRRLRRTYRQVLRYGRTAKRRHTRPHGRSGGTHYKQEPPKSCQGCSSSMSIPLPWMPTVSRTPR